MINQQDNLWEIMPQSIRKQLIWFLWFVTWIGLILGLFNQIFYDYVVIFSAFHALLILLLVRFRIATFPAQVRIAYLIWVAIGTYIPYMGFLMYITTVGLATNLFLDYCPLARLMYLLPWNREERFSFQLVKQVFLSPPVAGKFTTKDVQVSS